MALHGNIAIIGAGTVGCALAVEVHKRLYRVSALFTKHHHRSVRLPSDLRMVYRGMNLRLLPADTRVVLITVNDDEIEKVAAKLAAIPGYNWKGVVVLHVSGVLSSRIFSELKKRGAECGSMHPLQSFPRSLPVRKRGDLFYSISWGIEGDQKAVREARKIVRFFQGRTVNISPDEKVLYHAACVCVSNYFVTLLHMAEAIAGKSGVGRKAFLRAAAPLISTSLQNALDSTPVKALTGPIERGDEKTIRRHVDRLRRMVPGMLDTYAALGAETVTLALKKGTLKKEIAANLYRLFYTL
jgi:predicted short-subunit dehydrogenase-like oxidoreductase (DUF2520 family)